MPSGPLARTSKPLLRNCSAMTGRFRISTYLKDVAARYSAGLPPGALPSHCQLELMPSALKQNDACQQQQGGNRKPIAACPVRRHQHRLDLVSRSKTVFGGLAAEADQTDRDLVAKGRQRQPGPLQPFGCG